jgi:membrane-associated phospholipid phosphatase
MLSVLSSFSTATENQTLFMFQTEYNLYLQSFSSEAMTVFMRAISVTGDEGFFVVLIGVLMFGNDFKKGVLLFQIIIWTGLCAEILKELFAMPRPTWVDSAVQNIESGKPNTSVYTGMGAKGFFGSLPPEVVASYRLQGASYGFPSGHVSGALATWGGILLLFRRRSLYWILPIIAIAMGVSRMYLGRHFLVDVLGGAMLGTVALVVAHDILFRKDWFRRLLDRESYVLRSSSLTPLAVMFGVPLLLPLSSIGMVSVLSGYLMGMNTVVLILSRGGFPVEGGPTLKRAARVLIWWILFLAVTTAFGFSFDWITQSPNVSYFIFLKAAIPSFFATWSAVRLCQMIGLYERTSVASR